MFGFLVGWGVFWLLIWAVVLFLGVKTKDDNWIGTGLLLGGISFMYLIAVGVGRLVM